MVIRLLVSQANVSTAGLEDAHSQIMIEKMLKKASRTPTHDMTV